MIARGLTLLLLSVAPSLLSAQPLLRVIAPFPVERVMDEPMRNPFSGGLWQPRIGLRDVDGDLRPDLFALNPDGELRFYRNDGSFRFTRIIPSPYDLLPVRNWFRFADLDGDGAAELMTAGPRSEVMVIDNDGTDALPVFRVPERLLTASNGDTIRMQRETVPALADIDSDGDLDLFAGNLDGSIAFYRNIGSRTDPSFTFVTGSFEDILVISGGTARDRDDGALLGSRHGASVLDFADLDGDDDLDILFGDFFTSKLLLFENTGTATSPDFGMDRLDTAFRPTGDDVTSHGFNQPVTGDLDGDGDLDAIISSLYPTSDALPLVLYENVGTRTDPRMSRRAVDLTDELDVGLFAAPAVIEDATRNGLLVGSSFSRIAYLERVDAGGITRLRIAGSLPVPGPLTQVVPSAGDLDGDGAAELVVGESNGTIMFVRIVDGSLVRFGDTFQLNRNASPTLVDLDGDGDLDVFSGAENGRFAYFENVGSRTSPSFVRSTPPEPFDRLDVGYDSAPRFYDLDRDGDLDAMVGGRTGGAGGERDTLRFFIRDGAAYAPSARYPPVLVARNPVPMGLRVAEGSVILVGDLSGGIKAFIDSSQPTRVEAPSAASAISIEIVGGTVRVKWPEGARDRSLRIVDLLGRTILAAAGDAADAGFELGSLPEGFYLVEAIGGRRRTVLAFPIAR